MSRGQRGPVLHGEALGDDMPALDTASVLRLLMRKAEPQLSAPELRRMARDLPDLACAMAADTATVLDGIAGMVLGDRRPDGTLRAGNFQSVDDVPALLLHLAGVFTHIGGLVSVGDDAAAALAARGTS